MMVRVLRQVRLQGIFSLDGSFSALNKMCLHLDSSHDHCLFLGLYVQTCYQYAMADTLCFTTVSTAVCFATGQLYLYSNLAEMSTLTGKTMRTLQAAYCDRVFR